MCLLAEGAGRLVGLHTYYDETSSSILEFNMQDVTCFPFSFFSSFELRPVNGVGKGLHRVCNDGYSLFPQETLYKPRRDVTETRLFSSAVMKDREQTKEVRNYTRCTATRVERTKKTYRKRCCSFNITFVQNIFSFMFVSTTIRSPWDYQSR